MSRIQVTDLTFAYEGSYDYVFENVSFQLDTDWKLGFTGRNGRGKTTFLRLLMGQLPYSGTITAPVTFSYFPYAVPDPQRSTREILEEICPELVYWELSRELSLLEVDEEVLRRPFATLSQGERTKVLLAAMFLSQAGDVSRMWTWLGRIEPWLLMSLAALAVICLPIAFIRRKTP